MSNQFDEIAVGGQSNQDFMSRMEEEINKVREQELEEENKPLEEKIKSKNWKIRKNAYTEMYNKLKAAETRTDKVFLDYQEIYSVILEDVHAGAQEAALDVIKILFENYEYAGNIVPELFRVIIEKCFTSTRLTLRNKAKEILVLGVEVSQETNQITEVIRSGLENKNPKIGQASVNILTHLISLFGSFKIEFRSLIQLVEKLSENTQPQIRTDVLEFYKELYRWIKESIKPYVNRLKETHQKDLEKAFDEINLKWTQPVPIKFLKNDKNDKNNDNTNTNNETKNKMLLIQEEEKMFKNTEAVELFQGKFNDSWAEDLLAKERKWNERKEMLDNFISMSNVFKINNSGKSHIIAAFLKLLKDSNINVVSSTILAINNMAKGLRKDFIEAKDFLIILINLLKEKREKMIQDLFTCLDSLMTHCINIEEVIDDLRQFSLDNKISPQLKERFCLFINKTVLKTYIAQMRKVSKPLAEIMFKLSDDASSDVRNAALTALGVIKSRVGEMPISKILNEICDLKKKKVDEASQNVIVDPIYDKDDTVKKIGGNNIHKNNINYNVKKIKNIIEIAADVEMVDYNNNIMTIKTNNNMINDIEMNPISTTTNTNSNFNTLNPPNIKTTKSTSLPPKINPKQTQPSQNPKSSSNNIDIDLEAEEESSMSNEDVESFIKEKLGDETISLFNDTKWESRKIAFGNLAIYILENVEETNKSIEIFLRFIKLKLKDYKENNFNILKEALVAIQNLCENCNNFQKKHCIVIIKKTCEKIGDNKLKQNVLNLFSKFMEYHGPKYITSILLKYMTNNVKSPNVLKECSQFFEKSIEDFGINILPVKEIVDFGKFLATNTNPQVRSSATSLLCVIYKYIGPKIKNFLNDIKEATLKVIETEFEKVTVISNSENQNKRELKGSAAIEAQTSSNGNLIESLFPRVDISKKINQKLIKDLSEGKWQLKKEAIETLEKILNEANMRIQPNGLNELITCLKNKLDDGNKNLVRTMIQFITKLVEALGNTCRVFSKSLISPILRNLSDKMNLLREDVIKCLEKWSEMIGFENVLFYCPFFLLIDNFELRSDLLKLIIKNKSSLLKFDCKEIVPGVLACLLDKTPSIRQLGEELAKEMLRHININNFYNAMKDYKPAIANTIKGIIEKYASLICILEPNGEVGEIIGGINVIPNNISNNNVSNVNLDFKIPAVERAISANPKLNTNKNNIQIVNKNKRDSNSSKEDSKDSKSRNKKLINNLTNNNKSNIPNNNNTMPNIKPINVKNLPNNNNININNNSNNNESPTNTNIKPIQKSLLINSSIKINQKLKRLENEKNLQFPNEYVSQEFDQNLKIQMSQFINKSYIENAYSNDVAKFNMLFTIITNTMKSDPILFNEVTDIWLKWILIRNLEMNNNLFFNNIIFEFFKNLYEFLTFNECLLHETENKILIEILVSKVFTINSNAKMKAKSFFCDYSSSKLISLDMIIEMLSEKFNLIYDVNMKNEFVDLIKMIGSVCKYKVENINSLVSMYENSTKDENMKKSLYEIISEIYKGKEKKEDFNIIFESKSELCNLIEVKSVINNEVIDEINPEYQNKSHQMNFSRSPILSLQQRRLIPSINNDNPPSKESINLIDNIDQFKLNLMLNLLYSGNLNEKIKILLDLNDIFTNKYNEYVILLEKNIDSIIKSFSDLLKFIFTQNLSDESIDVLKYLLTVFYKAALTKDVIEHCEMETIYNSFEEILRSILYEGLENQGGEEEGKKIIKSLNALILKLMENFKPTFTFVCFIKLIRNYRTDNSRICSLSIKCLLKLSNIMPHIINNIEIEQILLAIFEFIHDFEKVNPDLITNSQNEEMCLKILRTIINEIIKLKNEGIWNYYKMSIERNNLPDKHLKRWIQLILRHKNGQSMPMSGQSNLSNFSNLNFSPNVENVVINNLANNLNSVNTFNLNNNILPSYETELKFYTDKLNIDSIREDKVFYEIIAILKRNKLNYEFMQNKMNDIDYDYLGKVFIAITKNENSNSQISNISNIENIEHSNNIDNDGTAISMTSNKFISNFNYVEKENSNNFIQNNLNTSYNSNSNSNVPIMPIKSLQEYRNKLHGLNEKSEMKINNNAISPIKPINQFSINNINNSNNNFNNNINNFQSNQEMINSSQISLENRKHCMDNYLKNKELLKKRDLSSEINQTPGSINNPTVHHDKLAEMKKRLDMLRTQKN